MNLQKLTIILAYIIGAVAGLMGNVVAGYIAPAFEGQRWLAVAIYFGISLAGCMLSLGRTRIEQPSGPGEEEPKQKRLSRLRQIVAERFDGEELRTLCFDLGIDYDDLPGKGKADKARELVAYLDRRARLPELIEVGRKQRPGVAWEGLLESAEEAPSALHHPPSERPLERRASAVSFLYSSLGLRWSLALLTLFLSLAIFIWLLTPSVSAWWLQRAPICPSDRTCVLVAHFTPEDSEIARQITQDIAQELRDVLEATGTQGFVVKTAPAVSDQEQARDTARQQGALLIVWGQVFAETDKLRLYFELTDRLGIGEAPDIRPFRVQPLQYDPVNKRVVCSNCLDLVARRANVVTYFAVGLVHYVQGRPEQARFDFLSALYCTGEPVDEKMPVLKPVCTPAAPSTDWNPGLLYYYAGKSLVLEGDYGGAITYLQKAGEHNSQDPAAWIGIGTAYRSWLARPDAPPAAEALRQAESRAQNLLTDIPPDQRAPVLFDLGLIRELLGDAAGAQRDYEEAVAQFGAADVSAYVSLIGLARAQAAAGNVSAAQQTLERARKLDAKSPWAYLELARLQGEDRPGAERALQEAQKQAPGEAYVAITRAELCEQWQDYACAADAYARALEKRPDSGWLHSRVGDFYRPTSPVLPHQSWEKAEERYRRAAELRPRDPWAQERLAYVLLNRQSYPESVQAYQKAIGLTYQGDAPAGLHCNLGVAQEGAGAPDEARESFQKCAEKAADEQQRTWARQQFERLSN